MHYQNPPYPLLEKGEACLSRVLKIELHERHHSLNDPLQVSILGASGYSGLELTRILLHHPHVKLHTLFANTSAGKAVAEVAPWFRGKTKAAYEEYTPEKACQSDLIFLALPSREAMNLVPELVNRGKKIIDLGGDFRLQDPALYERFYGKKHFAPSLLSNAVYGLPEWNRGRISKASFVANPGCYPTSAILPLAPLLKEGILNDEGIVVNSLSGVSGAGRSSTSELSFVEVNETVKAYKVGSHQHIPEINETLTAIAGRPIAVTFVPHLIPITRGIYTSIYASLRKPASTEEIEGIFQKAYGKEPFVRILPEAIPEIRNVNYSNFIDIGFRVDTTTKRIAIFSVIDNLIKGAAGQAVQNMNLMFGFNETEGLQ